MLFSNGSQCLAGCRLPAPLWRDSVSLGGATDTAGSLGARGLREAAAPKQLSWAIVRSMITADLIVSMVRRLDRKIGPLVIFWFVT
jgi:hypothetical protein